MSKALVCFFYHCSSSIDEYSFLVLFLTHTGVNWIPHPHPILPFFFFFCLCAREKLSEMGFPVCKSLRERRKKRLYNAKLERSFLEKWRKPGSLIFLRAWEINCLTQEEENVVESLLLRIERRWRKASMLERSGTQWYIFLRKAGSKWSCDVGWWWKVFSLGGMDRKRTALLTSVLFNFSVCFAPTCAPADN